MWELDHKECWAPKKWCFWTVMLEKRLLRIPWTSRRSSKSILKKINPEYSLEGLVLKLKLQDFDHLMWRANSLEKIPKLGKTEGKRKRGWQRMKWLRQHHWPNGHAAAVAAKLLQSCPTLCNPIDGSPRGSPVPGILQARTLEWVAISFSNAGKWKVKVISHIPYAHNLECKYKGRGPAGMLDHMVIWNGSSTLRNWEGELETEACWHHVYRVLSIPAMKCLPVHTLYISQK